MDISGMASVLDRLPKVQNVGVLIIFTLLHLASTTYSKTNIYSIHWNVTNPMFSANVNRDTVIDINGGNHPWEYDQVNIVCPFYEPTDNDVPENKQEKYIIYSVSKQEYESCRITQSTPKIVALCDSPNTIRYFTITFRSFTPTPGGLEFRPGQDYYFISTSSKNDLDRRVGGGCASNNMKVVFRVAPSDIEQLAEEDGEDDLVNQSIEEFSRPVSRHFPWSKDIVSTRYYHSESRSQLEKRRPKTNSDNYNSIKREASVMQSSSSGSFSSHSPDVKLLIVTYAIISSLITLS